MSNDERPANLHARSLAAAKAQLDSERHLIAQPAADDANVRTYCQAASLPLAYALLAEGDPASVAEGVAIVSAVLKSQETDPARRHHGNWRWLDGDPGVGALNAGQVVLRGAACKT